MWFMLVKVVLLLANMCGPDLSCGFIMRTTAFVCIIQILTIISDAVNMNVGHLYI